MFEGMPTIIYYQHCASLVLLALVTPSAWSVVLALVSLFPLIYQLPAHPVSMCELMGELSGFARQV